MHLDLIRIRRTTLSRRCAEYKDWVGEQCGKGGIVAWSGEKIELFDGISESDGRVCQFLELGYGSELESIIIGYYCFGIIEVDVYDIDWNQSTILGGEQYPMEEQIEWLQSSFQSNFQAIPSKCDKNRIVELGLH